MGSHKSKYIWRKEIKYKEIVIKIKSNVYLIHYIYINYNKSMFLLK